METRMAVYAGSFDPPTLGHAWMVDEGARLFDRLTVAIGTNPDKRYMFSTEERLAMLQRMTTAYGNVAVDAYYNKYLVDYAQSVGARYILRGIRNHGDYEYEQGMMLINKRLDPAIETRFLYPPMEIASISSSIVKGLIGFERWREVVSLFVPREVFDKILENFGRDRWRRLMEKLPKRQSSCTEAYNDLASRYAEPHRAYHTLNHILHCLEEFDRVKHLLGPDDIPVELAIWFHDAVYEPGAVDNEERSAELAYDFAVRQAAIPEFIGEVIASFVLVTKHSETPSTLSAEMLADIDLAILGQDKTVFDEYERNIRAEYRAVPENVFREKRAEFLDAFRKRGIYRTQFFRERYEKTALENLGRSIALLRA